MDKRIEELEQRVKELESKINKSSTMFGRSYSQVGSSQTDLLIKTRGQVKINWGSKTIDLIKDGKINSDSKSIFSVKSKDNIGSKDGIYYTQDGEIWLKVSSDIVQLSGNSESTFVSYNEQELSDEQKQQVLINIGLVCNSASIPQIQNGFIYVTDEDQFYIIHDGIMSKISADFPNPLTVQLKIDQNGMQEGSLILSGSGKVNGLNFGNSWLYEDNGAVIDSSAKIEFKVNSQNGLTVYSYGIKTTSVESDLIQSTNQSNGFKIQDGVLYCDHVEERNPSIPDNFSTFIYFDKALINDCLTTEDENIFELHLNKNPFKIGDIVVILTEDTYGDDSDAVSISKYIGEIVTNQYEESSNIVYFKFLGLDQDIADFKLDDTDLKGKYIYLYQRDNEQALVINNNSLYLGDNLLIGYDEDGIFRAGYPIDYNLPLDDNTSKFASTEWVREITTNSLPINTIIAFYGNSYPEGWILCDGTNGTPDLSDLTRPAIIPGNPSLVYLMKIV